MESKDIGMTPEERQSCAGTLKLLERLAFNVHGVMDTIDKQNIDKLVAMLENEGIAPLEDSADVYKEFKKMLNAFEGDEEPTENDMALMKGFCNNGWSDIHIRLRVGADNEFHVDVEGKIPFEAKMSILEMALAEMINESLMEAGNDRVRIKIIEDHFESLMEYINSSIDKHSPDMITC